MKKLVFAGPSIHGLDLAPFTEIEFRAPAAAGDLLQAAHQGARVIGLIDGVFEGAASVWHKEILAALTSNIPVYGAASMGALRACECASFGMVGVGQIFEDYASGRRSADADVAVQHGPQALGFMPLTLALVDVEATLARLADRLDSALLASLDTAARAVPFRNRNWRTICNQILDAPPNLPEDLENSAISQKQTDAAELLSLLQNLTAPPTVNSAFTAQPFSQTDIFHRLDRKVRRRVR